jgi:hypothetical protein
MAISKGSLLRFLQRAHQAELSYASDFDIEERAASGTEKDWAPKDLLAHLAAWKEIMANRLAAYRIGEDSEFTNDYDSANAEIFVRYQDSTWDEVMDLVERSYRGLVAEIQALPEEEFSAPARFNWQRRQPLVNRIALNGFFHPSWHIGEALLDQDKVDQALALVQSAVQDMLQVDGSAHWQGQYTYNQACFYALAGEKPLALKTLRLAFAIDSGMIEWALQDKDMDSLRDEPEFISLTADRGS